MRSWAVCRIGGVSMGFGRGSFAGWGEMLKGLGRNRHGYSLDLYMQVISVPELLLIPDLFCIFEMRNDSFSIRK